MTHPFRFGAMYALLGMLTAVLVAAAVGMAARGHRPAAPVRKAATEGCAHTGCAKLGDKVAYTLAGVVSSVSSPQPGVVCVQVSAKRSGGDYCELSG